MSKFTKQASIFEVELDHEDIIDVPEGYEKVMLSELDDDVGVEGRVEMSSVQAVTFDEDGEEVTKYRCQLAIFDDDAEDYTLINLNLKKEGDVQENIRKGSVLYDFITSVMELENPQSTANKNIIRKVNLETFREWINALQKITIKVVERNGDFVFNSFKVIDVE